MTQAWPVVPPEANGAGRQRGDRRHGGARVGRRQSGAAPGWGRRQGGAMTGRGKAAAGASAFHEVRRGGSGPLPARAVPAHSDPLPRVRNVTVSPIDARSFIETPPSLPRRKRFRRLQPESRNPDQGPGIARSGSPGRVRRVGFAGPGSQGSRPRRGGVRCANTQVQWRRSGVAWGSSRGRSSAATTSASSSRAKRWPQ